MMIEIVEIAILCLLGFFLSYLLLLSVLALFVPLSPSVQTARLRKFAVVVPAHNEQVTIGKTVQSLLGMEYPHDLVDIVVVADNCSDNTVTVARKEGAIAVERIDPTGRGKGQALQWAFGMLSASSSRYDAFVVIDADSVVNKNFLHVMNWYLEQGHNAIQAADLVAPNPDAWSSEVSRISLTLYNYVRPLGRKAIHCSAGLRGNGMCFSAGLLRSVPWQAHSITEDLEYGLILLLHGVDTVLAPEAIVFATMPSKPKNAESQRTRWEGGRIAVIKKYFLVLLKAAWKEFSWKKFDALIELVTPAFVNMVGIILSALGIKYFLSLWNISGAPSYIVSWWVLLGISVLYVLAGLRAARADRALMKAIVYFPRYLLWKMKLYFKFAASGISKEWVRTTREEKGSSS